MKINKKYALRIGTILCILLFLLIPLLSSQVAAPTTYSIANTDNLSSGPTVWIEVPDDPVIWEDEAPRTVTFICDVIFTDTKGGQGSNHWARLTVTKIDPEGEPQDDYTGIIPVIGTTNRPPDLSVTDTWEEGQSTYWIVYIEVSCTDIATSTNAYDSDSYDVWVDAS